MTQNEIKKAASLAHSKYRKKYGLFLVEGVHSVSELLKSRWRIESLIVSIEAEREPEIGPIIELADARHLPIHRISKKTLDHIAAVESPQGIIAIAVIPSESLSKAAFQPRLLIADQISDPGNFGAIIRSALAFGFGGVISTAGSIDFYNPKTVRASQGAMFHIVLAGHAAPEEILAAIEKSHKLYALMPRDGEDIRFVKPSERYALIVGNEASGISPKLASSCNLAITIPTPGRIESLNAAISASIAMYQLSDRG
jgi:TrmH family RNA methyltransferase